MRHWGALWPACRTAGVLQHVLPLNGAAEDPAKGHRALGLPLHALARLAVLAPGLPVLVEPFRILRLAHTLGPLFAVLVANLQARYALASLALLPPKVVRVPYHRAIGFRPALVGAATLTGLLAILRLQVHHH